MVFVLVSRSRKVVSDELVTLMSWDSRDFLIFLVMVGCKTKNVVRDGVVDLSCMLNCLRVSLLGSSSCCLTLSMMRFTLSGVSILGKHMMWARLVRDLITLSLEKEGAQEL